MWELRGSKGRGGSWRGAHGGVRGLQGGGEKGDVPLRAARLSRAGRSLPMWAPHKAQPSYGSVVLLPGRETLVA